MFGEKPSTKVHSPLTIRPESDTSELLDQTGVQQYQWLIGSLQWAILLGRFDIATAVMSLYQVSGLYLAEGIWNEPSESAATSIG
jgi:hypothetical protein